MNEFISLALCLYLLPASAWAQAAPVKDPLAYPLKQYVFILTISVVGGFVNYIRRARNGDLPTLGIAGLVGELATSAFVGVLTFWACEYFNAPPLVTAGLAGLAGHMGGNAIVWAEAVTKRKVEKFIGVTGPVPLGEPEL